MIQNKSQSKKERRIEDAIKRKNKRKKTKSILFGVIAIIIFACVIISSYASTPVFEVHNNLYDNVRPGDDSLGDLVFTKENYEPDYFDQSSLQNLSMQRYDILRWNGDSSINVINPENVSEILVKGSQYLFSQVGKYELNYLSNTSNKAFASVGVEDTLQINVNINNSKLDIEYDSFFTLVDEKVIDLETSIGRNLEPGNYDLSIGMESNSQLETIKHQVVIVENASWSIRENELNSSISIDAGNNENVGYFKIVNDGNVNIEIKASIQGNGSKFVKIQESQVILKGSYAFFSVALQVPSVQENGIYNATISLDSDEKSMEIPFTIEIKDFIEPEILDISFKDAFIWHKNEVKVEAKDNIGLDSATITYENNTFNMTKDQQFFFYEETFKKFEPYNFSICVYDTSNNSVCENVTQEFQKLSIINAFNTNKASPKKAGKFSKSLLLNLSEKPPEPLRLTLIDLTSEFSDVNLFEVFDIRIVDGDGTTSSLDRINHTIQVIEAGEIYLEVRSENETEYSVIIDVETPEYMEDFSTVTINGEFRDYDVPENFEMNWFDGVLSCEVVDTGEIKDSKIVCPLEFPITASVDSLAIPVTVSEMKEYQDKIEELKTAKGKASFIYGLICLFLGFVIFAMLMVIWFVGRIYPIMRFKFGGDDK